MFYLIALIHEARSWQPGKNKHRGSFFIPAISTNQTAENFNLSKCWIYWDSFVLIPPDFSALTATLFYSTSIFYGENYGNYGKNILAHLQTQTTLQIRRWVSCFWTRMGCSGL